MRMSIPILAKLCHHNNEVAGIAGTQCTACPVHFGVHGTLHMWSAKYVLLPHANNGHQ